MAMTMRELSYGTIDTSDAADAGYFAVPAFFITFREFLEGAIVIAILLGLLDKLNLPKLRIWVWLGVAVALVLCVIIAIIFIVLITVLKDQIVDEQSELILNGVIAVVAAALIAVVALAIGNVLAIHEKYEKRLREQLDDEDAISAKAVFLLAFTTVVREGLETIIFFVGIGAAYPAESLPVPAITGAIVGTLVGILLYKFGGRLTITVFSISTMVLLVFIGAGVFTNGIHSLQEAGSFGEYGDERSGLHVVLWDISECCGYDKNEGWVMFRVLFGYTPYPTGLEAMCYCLYHVFVWSGIAFRTVARKRRDQGLPPLLRCPPWKAVPTIPDDKNDGVLVLKNQAQQPE